jgi:predicted transcriptional regulator
MTPFSASQPRHLHYSARRQARLDAETHAKLEELTRTFRRKRSAILRYVMQWALTYMEAWMIDPSIPHRPHLVHMLLERELLQQVQEAPDAHSVSVAAWLRHAMRQVTREDFPPSWRAGESAVRSHDSGHYGRRFMLRFDDETLRKLDTLTQTFQRSAAEVIRQLIAQARPEEFPQSWRLAEEERRQQGSSAGRERSRHGRRPRDT